MWHARRTLTATAMLPVSNSKRVDDIEPVGNKTWIATKEGNVVSNVVEASQRGHARSSIETAGSTEHALKFTTRANTALPTLSFVYLHEPLLPLLSPLGILLNQVIETTATVTGYKDQPKGSALDAS